MISGIYRRPFEGRHLFFFILPKIVDPFPVIPLFEKNMLYILFWMASVTNWCFFTPCPTRLAEAFSVFPARSEEHYGNYRPASGFFVAISATLRTYLGCLCVPWRNQFAAGTTNYINQELLNFEIFYVPICLEKYIDKVGILSIFNNNVKKVLLLLVYKCC